ncbi:MAG: hypothetical protein ABEJ22_06355, partial [Haloferacaceae archaeon]
GQGPAGDQRLTADLRSERATQAGRAVAAARGEEPTETTEAETRSGRSPEPTDEEPAAPPVEVARRALDDAPRTTGGRGGLGAPDERRGSPEPSDERREPTASATRERAADGGSDAAGSPGDGTVDGDSASTADGDGLGLVDRLRGVL